MLVDLQSISRDFRTREYREIIYGGLRNEARPGFRSRFLQEPGQLYVCYALGTESRWHSCKHQLARGKVSS
jgi:hypothetical protein